MMKDGPSTQQDNLTIEEISQKVNDLCNSKSDLLRVLGIIRAYTMHYKFDQRSIIYDENDILNEVITNLLTPTKYHWPRCMSNVPHAFILLSAKRLCIEILRAQSWRWKSKGDYDQDDETFSDNSNPESIITAMDWARKLASQLGGNKSKEEVFWLKYAFGYTYEEIGKLVGLSVEDVKASIKYIQRAQADMAAKVTQ
jgi:DNA-directed RNA polymerase specialized sigma24 family protein